MDCPKCKSDLRVKSGFVQSKQRYKCRACGCNYTKSERHHIPASKRMHAINLYLEGVGFRGIERITGISNVTVMRWVRALGDKIPQESEAPKEVRVMELDELWHFIGKKSVKSGCGLRMIAMEDKSVPCKLVAVESVAAEHYGDS